MRSGVLSLNIIRACVCRYDCLKFMYIRLCTRHTPVQRTPGLCSRGKASWLGVYRPPTSGADVKERVELVTSPLPLWAFKACSVVIFGSTLTDNMGVYGNMYRSIRMYLLNVGIYVCMYVYVVCLCAEYAYA